MHTFTFKASDDVYKKLSKFAKAEERPLSYLIRKAVENYIAKMEAAEAGSAVMRDKIYD